MRITSKLVLKISTGEVLEHEYKDYNGPIAHCGGGGSSQKPQVGESAKIIGQLSPEIVQGVRGQILDPTSNENLTKRTMDLAVQNSNAGFGARGLAGSGIAQRGAEQAGTDAALAGAQQQQQALIGLLGAGSGSPTFSTPPQPRGLFGLK